MSQRARILWILFLAILPLLALAGIALQRELQEGEGQIAQDRAALARATSLATQAFVDGHVSTVQTLAVTLSTTGTLGTGDVSAFLAAALQVNPDWEGLVLIDADGWTQPSAPMASGPPAPALNVADRPYFQEVMATRRPVISSGIVGRVSGLPTVVLAVPADFASGAPGVLVAPIPTERLHVALRAQIGTDSLLVVIVDRSGQTIVHRDPEKMRTLEPVRGRPDVDAVLAGAVGSRVVDLDGVETLVAYAPVSDYGWGVLIVEATATAFAPADSKLRWDVAFLLLVLAVVVGIGWYLSGRLSLFYERLIEARKQADKAREDGERARRHAQFLADVSRELESSPDHEAALASLARLAAPEIADWCAVDVVTDSGGARRLAVAHADPSKVELAAELAKRYPSDPSASSAISEGKSQLVTDIPDALLVSAAQDEEHLRVLRGLGLKSAMVVPLRARGHTLGAITFVAAESGHSYDDADLIFAENLAGRAALVVENARLRDDLQQALDTRDEFLAAASHDLRNPLAAIKATAQVLKLQLERRGAIGSERLARMLESIDVTSTRMGRIIDGFLDVAHLQLGRPLELERRPTDVTPLVRQVADECQQSTSRHRIMLEAENEVVANCDSIRLQRALSNLLENAVKYSPQGGTIRVILHRDTHHAVAVLRVKDDGLGIPEADLPRIFDRFRRGSNVIGGIAGTGIGLASVRQIVEEHGGTISVESQVGLGTEVKVRLPLEFNLEQDDLMPAEPGADGGGRGGDEPEG